MPAAHTLFGISQTINAANLLMFKALKLADTLSPTAIQIFTDSVTDEHIGQGMDLHWKFQTKIPSEEDYFTMVDGSKFKKRPGNPLLQTLKSLPRNWRSLPTRSRPDAF